MVTLAEKIREEGIELESVSLGSTPTAEFAARVEGVTEIRPGALRIASALQPRAVVAPPLPYGVSYHHISFPGTMTVSPEPDLHPAALWYARENAVRHSASRSLNILVIEHLGRCTASWNDFH
ncbi:MAG TPA: creatininase family protein [Rubrobacteraceae bacterium]|nr:creatininase family protein [Rubrobacteraceae bacterium]